MKTYRIKTPKERNKKKHTITLPHHVCSSSSLTNAVLWGVSFEINQHLQQKHREVLLQLLLNSSKMSKTSHLETLSVNETTLHIKTLRETQLEVKATLNWPHFNPNLILKWCNYNLKCQLDWKNVRRTKRGKFYWMDSQQQCWFWCCWLTTFLRN